MVGFFILCVGLIWGRLMGWVDGIEQNKIFIIITWLIKMAKNVIALHNPLNPFGRRNIIVLITTPRPSSLTHSPRKQKTTKLSFKSHVSVNLNVNKNSG